MTEQTRPMLFTCVAGHNNAASSDSFYKNKVCLAGERVRATQCSAPVVLIVVGRELRVFISYAWFM